MNIEERINMILLLLQSTKESIEEYSGNKYGAGYEYPTVHSAASIQERCKVARRELLLIMKELS